MVSSAGTNNSKKILLPSQELPNSHLPITEQPGSKISPSVSAMTHRVNSTHLEKIDHGSTDFVFKQPELQPLSLNELLDEVKRANSCIVQAETDLKNEFDHLQNSGHGSPVLTDGQFQNLNALYIKLLGGHHDFIMATQSPVATLAVRNLPYKWKIPEQMIQQGIEEPIKFFGSRDLSKAHYLRMLYFAHGICSVLSEIPQTDIKKEYIDIRERIAGLIEAASDLHFKDT